MSVNNPSIQPPQGVTRKEHLESKRQARAQSKIEETAATKRQLKREAWLVRLGALRTAVGTGKQGHSTESILDDLRSERA